MAFKYLLSSKEDGDWGSYWDKISVTDHLKNCNTDGLLPYFKKYLSKKSKILEAGCGLGKWVIFWRKRGYDIFGVDSHIPTIKALKNYDKTLSVTVGNVEKLDFSDNEIDIYLSFGVIEHWEEGPQKVLREAWRVIKSGGLAIVETPLDNWFRRLRRFIRRRKIKGYFHEYRFTKNELENFVKEAGFKILETGLKDDLSTDRSIGLWSDYPLLRQKNSSNFQLNILGRIIKKFLSPFPWLWSACVVVIAKKP